MNKLGVNIQFIRGQYFARKVIPAHLREILGQTQFSEALGADPKTARKKAHAHLAAFEEKIDAAEQHFQNQQPTVSSAAKALYALEQQLDDRTRAAGINEVSNLLFDGVYASRLRAVSNGIITGDEAEALIGYAADDLIAKKLASVSTPGERSELLRVLASVRFDSLAMAQSRDSGVLTDPDPKTVQLHEPDPTPVVIPSVSNPKDKHARNAVTLTKLVERFNLENSEVAEATKKERVVAFRMFREFLGSDKGARDITDDDVIAYKNALLELPSNYQQRFHGMTLPQAIRANAKRKNPYPPLSNVTINAKWLMHLGTVFRWAVAEKLMSSNPAQFVKVRVKRQSAERARSEFSSEELRAIFSDPIFKQETYGSRQWALLLALYTAARNSSELRKVELNDIYIENGVLVIHFAQASKNRHSKRIVPIHEDLLKLGLLDYINRLKMSGETRLFPDWEPEDKINRWVNRTFLPKLGIKRDNNDFYTLRHTMKTAMARAGVKRDINDLICGHEDQSAGGVYIADHTVTMIQTMHLNINRVQFDVLTHIGIK